MLQASTQLLQPKQVHGDMHTCCCCKHVQWTLVSALSTSTMQACIARNRVGQPSQLRESCLAITGRGSGGDCVSLLRSQKTVDGLSP